MSDIIPRALGEVAQLTELIEVSAMRDADWETTIEFLRSIIANPEDTPEGRGEANEAREKLRALRMAAEQLAAVLRGV